MTTRTWRLAPQVHAAACGEDLVILDVDRDSYFCLPEGAAGVRATVGRTGLKGLSADVADELLAAGLLVLESGVQVGRRTASRARRDLFDQPLSAGSRDAIGLVGAMVTMSWRFHRRSFRSLVAHASINRGSRRDDPAVAASTALALRKMLPWSPVQGACLFQSFLLLDLLRGRGVAADWVFGVRTWPFSAHCWIQTGGLVLNDTVDHVTSFEPIMVV